MVVVVAAPLSQALEEEQRNNSHQLLELRQQLSTGSVFAFAGPAPVNSAPGGGAAPADRGETPPGSGDAGGSSTDVAAAMAELRTQLAEILVCRQYIACRTAVWGVGCEGVVLADADLLASQTGLTCTARPCVFLAPLHLSHLYQRSADAIDAPKSMAEQTPLHKHTAANPACLVSH